MDELQTLRPTIDWPERMKRWNAVAIEAARRMWELQEAAHKVSVYIEQVTMTRCKLCGERYRNVQAFDLRRVCPDCWSHLEKVSESVGPLASPESLQAALFGLAPSHGIRYGRPWQEHVKDRRVLT